MEASPAKLPDDTWGVRVYDPAGDAGSWSGQGVTVESKGGKTWMAQLGELVENDPDKHVAKYRKVSKKKADQLELPPIAGGADPEPVPTSSERLYIDVSYVAQLGTYGPFENRQTAEQVVIALASRPDVIGAKIRKGGQA